MTFLISILAGYGVYGLVRTIGDNIQIRKEYNRLHHNNDSIY